MSKKDKKKKLIQDEAAGMAAAVEREAAAAATAAQDFMPSQQASPAGSAFAAQTPSLFGSADAAPNAFASSPSTAAGADAQGDSVTRIDFNSGEDAVTRLDFSAPAADDGVTRVDFATPSADDGVVRIDLGAAVGDDAVVRLDFGSGASAETDSVTRLDFSSPDAQPDVISQQPLQAEVLQPVQVTQPAQAIQVEPLQAMPLEQQATVSAQPDPVQQQPVQQVLQQAQQMQQQPAAQQPVQQVAQQQPVQQVVQQQPVQQVLQQVAQQQPVQQVLQQAQQVQQQPAEQQPVQQPAQQVQQQPAQQQPVQQPVQQQVQQPAQQPMSAAALTAEEQAADRMQAANKPRPDEVTAAKAGLERIISNVETVVIGKREPVSLVVLALIARGHVLLEDLPGTGKTTLVSALARSIACDFSRIQFTPDIMPSDVSGFSIYNQKTNDFEFRPGGVMSNLVLADEINRASAKTQSALLEAMEERQVTVDGKTYRLPEPFMVLATQNPIEQFGTYPLPEAQVDRFLVKLSMGYPGFEQEVRVLELGDKAKKALTATVSSADVLALREIASRVYASRIVLRYIVEVITATRDNPEVQVGSSPRGGIALLALARAYALLQGRAYVIPDDVKYLAPHVLCHRVSLAHEAKVAGRTERQVIESILSGIAVPYYDEAEAQGLR